jgi:predicted nucleic acid-binding protein
VGLTVLDASVLIGVLDAEDVHHAAARDALTARLARGDALIVPATAYAEALVGPIRRGPEAAATVDAFIEALPARVEPATAGIARLAAGIRAEHGGRLRLPDAFVIATALELGADQIVTADRRWPDLSIEVAVLGG